MQRVTAENPVTYGGLVLREVTRNAVAAIPDFFRTKITWARAGSLLFFFGWGWC